jgi:hypothetical protein
MRKRLLGIVALGAMIVYGAGCLLPANLLIQLADDVINGSDDENNDDIDDVDTNGESDTPEE